MEVFVHIYPNMINVSYIFFKSSKLVNLDTWNRHIYGIYT